MHILMHTRFYPNLGGIETVAWVLAHEWHAMGESVTVLSDVACTPAQRRDLPFPVHYRPGPLEWIRLLRKADVFAHMNISLKAIWPLLFVWKPFVAVHHTHYYSDLTGHRNARERLKVWLTKSATNIAVSKSVASRMPAPCVVIPNPADLSLFLNGASTTRDRDIVFLGRLVSEKGCDLLLQALARMASRGVRPSLTIIGDGPERPKLDQLVVGAMLQDRVTFAGPQMSDDLARLLRRHNIMVVPSTYEEPFGVVALEGAASGCVVLGSDGGGLPEAIGPAGMTFRRNDADDLADKLTHLLQHPEGWRGYREAAPQHLALHHPRRVAAKYLEVFRQAAASPQ